MIKNKKLDKVLESLINLPQESKQPNKYIKIDNTALNDKLEIIVKHNGSIDDICNIYNASIEKLSNKYSIITIHKNRIKELSKNNKIEYIEKSKRLIKLKNNYKLKLIKGVNINDSIIGIVDTDIDCCDTCFINQDGTTRVLSYWNQNANNKKTPRNHKLNGEISREEINNTYLGNKEDLKGILWEKQTVHNELNVDYIMVKLKNWGENGISSTTEYIRALIYLINKAKSYNKQLFLSSPFLINANNKNDYSLFNEIIKELLQRNKVELLAEKSIREGKFHHADGRIEEKNRNEVRFEVGDGERVVTLELWKSFFDEIDIEIVMPSGIKTGKISYSKEITKLIIDDLECYVYFKDPTRIHKDQLVYVLIIPKKETVEKGLWTLKLYGNRIIDGSYDVFFSEKQMVHQNTRFIEETRLNNNETSWESQKGKKNKLAKASGYRSSLDSKFKNKKKVVYTTDFSPSVMNPTFLSYIPQIYKKYR